jgi:hypothetical protein
LSSGEEEAVVESVSNAVANCMLQPRDMSMFVGVVGKLFQGALLHYLLEQDHLTTQQGLLLNFFAQYHPLD